MASSPGFTAGAPPPGAECHLFSEGSFLAELGGRVREMRAVCGLSRRELARQSGISERYVAQSKPGRAMSRSCSCFGSQMPSAAPWMTLPER